MVALLGAGLTARAQFAEENAPFDQMQVVMQRMIRRASALNRRRLPPARRERFAQELLADSDELAHYATPFTQLTVRMSTIRELAARLGDAAVSGDRDAAAAATHALRAELLEFRVWMARAAGPRRG
jgi:hypothetical protein